MSTKMFRRKSGIMVGLVDLGRLAKEYDFRPLFGFYGLRVSKMASRINRFVTFSSFLHNYLEFRTDGSFEGLKIGNFRFLGLFSVGFDLKRFP